MIGAAMLCASVPHAPVLAEEGGGGATDPTLVPMTEIAVPIIDGSVLEGVLRFTLVLRARDNATAAVLVRDAARLRSVAVGAGLDFARLRASPYRAVDAVRLASALDAALRAAEPGVAQVLVIKLMAAPK